MKNPAIVITLVTAYLFVFTVLSRFDTGISLMLLMFSLSPVFMLWMVYVILKHGKYTGKELSENEEWGYQDISREELKTF